jgi:uncharacterized integral membrane protein (TIGR00698 family)
MSDTLIKMPEGIKKLLFSLLLGLIIGFGLDAPLALLSGILFALIIGNPFTKYQKKTVTYLLQISIVCLGFNVSLQHALQAGSQGFVFTLATIILTLTLGIFLGKRLGIDSTTSYLISSGTAICGGSAIAAVAPLVKANEQQISVSLGTIFILNAIALFVFPTLGHWLGFTDKQFGTWCAIAIHDTSSVVGAAKQYGNGIDALNIATTIKLERALWIIPLSLVTAWYERKHHVDSHAKIKIPYFIFLFIVAIFINSYFPFQLTWQAQSINVYQQLYLLGKKGLVITLFLIGSGLSIKTIKSVGFKPVLQGVLLWLFISITSLLVIKNLL